MKKTLYIYIFKEIMPTFFMSLFVLSFVLMMDKFLKLTELIISKGVAITMVLKLFIYIIPSLMVITIPMSLLIAIIFAFSRFSSDSEVVAMKSCGISLYNMFPPVLIISVIMYMLTAVFTLYAAPRGNRLFEEATYDILKNKLDLGIKERIFSDDFKDVVIYANKVDDKSGELSGVIISDTRDIKSSNTIIAKSGRIFSDKEKMEALMVLDDGAIHKKTGEDEYHIINFKNYKLKINMDEIDVSNKSDQKKQMGPKRLLRMIKELEEQGLDNNSYKVTYYKMFSLPVSCIVFGIIASPLGIYSKRSGRSMGLTVGIFVILIYYLLLMFSESVGGWGVIPPIFSMWIPNIIVGALAAFIFIKTANESPVMLFDYMGRFSDIIISFFKKKR